MTMHLHGTPITPLSVLYTLAGRSFCVSHLRPEQMALVHGIGQSVMADNGAFSKWKRGAETDWPGYYAWTDRWLDYQTTWAVIPDEINAPSQMQDALINEWPHGKRQAAPVWHLDEPIYRLLRLCEQGWNRVCMGSTAEYRVVLSDPWRRRMDECWDAIAITFGRPPPIHMLRGMQLAGREWPFASLDSTDVAQNHNRPQNTARAMADRWDAMQCPARWTPRPQQLELVA